MNWNHVWELFKINLLYANPQAVTNLQKRQEKKKKANFSIVNAMLRQQLLILVVFTVVYSYLFVGVDYKANPGVLTLYLLTFSIMGLLQTFTALYSTFYDSKDSKAYLPLPLKPSEVFLAKTLSGSMVGTPPAPTVLAAAWRYSSATRSSSRWRSRRTSRRSGWNRSWPAWSRRSRRRFPWSGPILWPS